MIPSPSLMTMTTMMDRVALELLAQDGGSGFTSDPRMVLSAAAAAAMQQQQGQPARLLLSCALLHPSCVLEGGRQDQTAQQRGVLFYCYFYCCSVIATIPDRA
jgi:hypothetical protein